MNTADERYQSRAWQFIVTGFACVALVEHRNNNEGEQDHCCGKESDRMHDERRKDVGDWLENQGLVEDKDMCLADEAAKDLRAIFLFLGKATADPDMMVIMTLAPTSLVML